MSDIPRVDDRSVAGLPADLRSSSVPYGSCDPPASLEAAQERPPPELPQVDSPFGSAGRSVPLDHWASVRDNNQPAGTIQGQ